MGEYNHISGIDNNAMAKFVAEKKQKSVLIEQWVTEYCAYTSLSTCVGTLGTWSPPRNAPEGLQSHPSSHIGWGKQGGRFTPTDLDPKSGGVNKGGGLPQPIWTPTDLDPISILYIINYTGIDPKHNFCIDTDNHSDDTGNTKHKSTPGIAHQAHHLAHHSAQVPVVFVLFFVVVCVPWCPECVLVRTFWSDHLWMNTY